MGLLLRRTLHRLVRCGAVYTIIVQLTLTHSGTTVQLCDATMLNRVLKPGSKKKRVTAIATVTRH